MVSMCGRVVWCSVRCGKREMMKVDKRKISGRLCTCACTNLRMYLRMYTCICDYVYVYVYAYVYLNDKPSLALTD